MAKTKNDNKNTKNSLDNLKMEVASELGVDLKKGKNSEITSAQAGKVGGEMVKRMIADYKKNM